MLAGRVRLADFVSHHLFLIVLVSFVNRDFPDTLASLSAPAASPYLAAKSDAPTTPAARKSVRGEKQGWPMRRASGILYIQIGRVEQAGKRTRSTAFRQAKGFPMTHHDLKEVPIALRNRRKSDLRTQFAALCFCVDKGKPRVLMVTSRGTGRWILPKGWPIDGKTPAEAALREAWEEAGVKGRVAGRCLGLFSYRKILPGDGGLPCVAMVYPVRVTSLAGSYPEKGQRRRKWMTPAKAATKVEEPELAQILRAFDPARLSGRATL